MTYRFPRVPLPVSERQGIGKAVIEGHWHEPPVQTCKHTGYRLCTPTQCTITHIVGNVPMAPLWSHWESSCSPCCMLWQTTSTIWSLLSFVTVKTSTSGLDLSASTCKRQQSQQVQVHVACMQVFNKPLLPLSSAPIVTRWHPHPLAHTAYIYYSHNTKCQSVITHLWYRPAIPCHRHCAQHQQPWVI
jgi:hypothetical protein